MLSGPTGAVVKVPLGILVQRPRLRNRFLRFLYLRISFEQNLEAFLLVERRHEHFMLDLPLDPIKALGHFGFRISDGVLAEILAERAHHVVVRLKFLGDRGLVAEEVARKSAYTRLRGPEHVVAVE